MKRFLLGTVFAAFSLSSAWAADAVIEDAVEIPIASVYDWSGAYIGVFAGGGRGNADVFDLDVYNDTGLTQSSDPSGFFGGAYAGYNWQFNSIVAGVEAELGYLGLDDSAQFPGFIGVRSPTDSLATIDTDFYASLTARLGYAFDNILIYAKGGVAGLNTEVSYIDNDPIGTTLVSGTSESDFLIGYTVGGGVEVGINQNWRLKGEYMFADFGDISHTATASGGGQFAFSHELDEVHTAK
ncbi:MAG: porin family protein, partial [Pseudaminobacter sp.]|nr:porin family protein [Pseudaminobacter sp.]